MIILQPTVRLADPHICSDARSRLNILTAVFDALVRRDQNGRFVPALAASWQLAADAHTWTFDLRDDVVFHNGERLTAETAVLSLQRACDPAVGGELGTEGVWASYLGDAAITAVGPHRLQVVTGQPMADLLELLVDIPIVAPASFPNIPQQLVGSGPWQLLSQNEQEVVLLPFANSRVRQPVGDRLVWRAVPDKAARLVALLAGEADWVTDLAAGDVGQLETADFPHLSHASNLCVAFLCNASRGATASQPFRQALNYATNVTRLIQQARGGGALPLNGPLTPRHFGCDVTLPPYPYDPTKARQLLAEANVGYSLTIDLPMRLPDEAPLLGELLAEDLAAVGLDVTLRHYEDRTAYAHMVKAKQIHDMCCFDSSPLSTYRVLREKLNSDVAGPWWQGYDNPQVNGLLAQAAQTVDDGQRQAVYHAAYRLLHEDAPWLFLYRPLLFWGVGKTAVLPTVSSEGLLRWER